MLTQEQFDTLVTKVGTEAADKIKKQFETSEKSINDKIEDVAKGQMTKADFELFKSEQMVKVTEQLTKLEGIMSEQGTVINAMKEGGEAKPKTLEDVLSNPETLKKIKEVQKNGSGVVEIELGGIALKTPGTTSIGNSIQPMTPAPNSPYLPAAAPVNATNFFGIIYNPNFITNYVNMGRTNFAFLPWVNETSVEGGADRVQESALKPLFNTRFKVQMSEAKKIAVMTTITEEFDQDLPGFTTIVERLLRENVTRKWDDDIYTAVIAAASAYTMTGLDGKIDDSNYWDALRALIAQIGKNNFTANFIGVNPVTSALIDMQKSATDRLYLTPPFAQRISSNLREGNKVEEDKAIVGDISQFNVDMYKDLVLKVGFNSDDFRRNQFSVVAELRYHDYISDNRKAAIVYKDLSELVATLDSGS